MTVKLRLQRWRCRNGACKRKTFVEQLPEIAAPRARRATRAAELVHLFGHGVGGRPGERLMKRIGMPTSDDTIPRGLKRRAKARRAATNIRIVGVDDWAWRKGSTYGTIIVDLERREVVDLLPDRSASMTADWLKRHPDIEIISRDRLRLVRPGRAGRRAASPANRRSFSYFAELARGHSSATQSHGRVVRAPFVAGGR